VRHLLHEGFAPAFHPLHAGWLREIHLLHLRQKPQKFGLAMAVHDFTDIISCQFSIFIDLQLICIDIVNTVSSLQEFTKISKASAQNSDLVTTSFKHRHQPIGSFRYGKMLCNVLHHAHIKSL